MEGSYFLECFAGYRCLLGLVWLGFWCWWGCSLAVESSIVGLVC